MKKLLYSLVIAIVSQVSYSADFYVTATTGSTPVVAAANVRNATAWATNVTYAAGQYVKANNKAYLCIGAGTSATTGNGPDTLGRVTDGTVTWISSLAHDRERLVIVNDGGATVYLSFNGPAVVGSGTRLNANGGSLTLPLGGERCSQGMITVISSSASNNVSVSEQ